MNICMYACMYVLYAYIRVCMHLCGGNCPRGNVQGPMYVLYAYIHVCIHCMRICMYVYMYACVHTCIYIYIYVIFKLGFERYRGGIVLVGRGIVRAPMH